MDYIFSFVKATWYLWALILLLGIMKLFRPVIKGFIGEKSVISYLSRLDKSKYLLLNNIMAQVGSKTTQIDHIVVSNFGVFVIETKNYKGWIVGNEYDDNWTQVIYKKKEKLHNPIKQNYGHILALKELLKDFGTIEYISIVTFSPSADLRVKAETPVVYYHKLAREIKKRTSECITDEEKNLIFARIQSSNIDSSDNRKLHVQAIESNIENQDYKLKNGVCPKCGGAMVQRVGKNGPFRGCANFPKCRFTIQ